ncbi:type II toxin-antitoxin system PemK/MazF family toxin [Candidatus Pacebacteria bacterium]|nr:type II toxin-antitoxin system PemK/MazF family toxin [Candidatus Paceibacterota bacterium]
MRDFDSWNTQKKLIHQNNKNKLYHPRDVWWCSLGNNIGFEQNGSGKEYDRPVLILKGFNKEVCLIVPLTTSSKKNKYMISAGEIEEKPAQAIISQIKLIDTKRLVEKICFLKLSKFNKIRKAVRNLI